MVHVSCAGTHAYLWELLYVVPLVPQGKLGNHVNGYANTALAVPGNKCPTPLRTLATSQLSSSCQHLSHSNVAIGPTPHSSG